MLSLASRNLGHGSNERNLPDYTWPRVYLRHEANRECVCVPDMSTVAMPKSKALPWRSSDPLAISADGPICSFHVSPNLASASRTQSSLSEMKILLRSSKRPRPTVNITTQLLLKMHDILEGRGSTLKSIMANCHPFHLVDRVRH